MTLGCESRRLGRGWAAVGVVLMTALLALVVAWPSEADAAKRTVACFKSTVPQGQKPKFRDRPNRCVFIAAGAVGFPIPPSFAVQQIVKIKWNTWAKRRAKGRGKGYTSVRSQPVPVTVTLSKPRRKCGHRAYTKAKFKYQYGIPAEPLVLPTC
jgi:hypothetical protein